jgi:hypothetical protein
MRAVARKIAACVAIFSSGSSAPDSPTPRTEAVWRRGPEASKTPQKLLPGMVGHMANGLLAVVAPC